MLSISADVLTNQFSSSVSCIVPVKLAAAIPIVAPGNATGNNGAIMMHVTRHATIAAAIRSRYSASHRFELWSSMYLARDISVHDQHHT